MRHLNPKIGEFPETTDQVQIEPRLRVAGTGFALVATLLMMVLLSVLALGLLSLSAIGLRQVSSEDAMQIARANARLALMIAIGELQKEMGPDMRVSAESAILDKDEKTEAMDDVARSHWLGSYDSWGNWLNADYTRPGGGASLKIQDTYIKGRRPMFRRWLLSLPPGQETNFDAPVLGAGMDDSNSVVLVGPGSLGASAGTNPDRINRAYLTTVGTRGKNAWWIGAENQKAKIDLAKNPRTQVAAAWETSQGDTAEVGVGSLNGFQFLDTAPALSSRLVSHSTLEVAGASRDDTNGSFFDLTAHSKGVIASVRTGHLKKDLSLLFEQPNSSLPDGYQWFPGDGREPSIRPMSPELLAKTPSIPSRHFASWTNMRHFYRMYRSSSDATPGGSRGTGGSGSLQWSGQTPFTDPVCRIMDFNDRGNTWGYGTWKGSNNYWRTPLLAKITFIYSLLAEAAPPPNPAGTYYHYLVYTPVFTLWNPYNTELRIPDGALRLTSNAWFVLPMKLDFYLDTGPANRIYQSRDGFQGNSNITNPLRSGTSGPIVFKPGEFKVFSNPSINSASGAFDMTPGFNPLGISGGDRTTTETVNSARSPSQRPGIALYFGSPGSFFNINLGNTPASLTMSIDWGSSGGQLPTRYQHDWFQKDQIFTPVTMDPLPIPAGDPHGIASIPANIEHWVYDGKPLPVAYVQLVMKGITPLSYKSIKAGNPAPNNWAQDWRSRNWIQAPPFYMGSGMYISENPEIAHTQRMDNPYSMNFGPLSNLGEAVALVDPFRSTSRAALGSGLNAAERVANVSASELPTAPIGSLAGFAGMRINPGWSDAVTLNTALFMKAWENVFPPQDASLYHAEAKAVVYQSGVTGPAIGNSFIHPVIARDGVYTYLDNSVSQDPFNRYDVKPSASFKGSDNKMFNDYWDHVFLLNDALWDDYFVSSLADQTRPGATAAQSLSQNLDRLIAGTEISNSRYQYYSGGKTTAKADLQDATGYLKAAKYLMVDGMFNVNSTSVPAWQALFAGIRERVAVYRDSTGAVQKIDVPSGKRIAITRLNTEVSNVEMDSPTTGAAYPDGWPGWTGVRFLDDTQLQKLAQECVKQVKKRGPFLNFAEFINRRLSNDELGVTGALQSAIDYDDGAPDTASINYRFKSDPDYMIKPADLGSNRYKTPEAAIGSRFAGIPGYVIQSDLLKPIGNLLGVRDDTFRIRAYGEALDANGKVTARAWCEAIVQRVPEYTDSGNAPEVPSRQLDITGSTKNPMVNLKLGTFSDNPALSNTNFIFGRKFRIETFRWLNKDEI